ncbi:MAG: DUF3419 family protein [Bacilli bacterium]|nr:DUF3419 family protein [Bacilli bacterium]
MRSLDYDIRTGVAILHGSEHFPDDYNYIYVSTNEFVSGYYKYVPLEGKRVLTVAASGDHILQAVSNGAKEIDTFDKNRFQIYFAKLKLAALKTLSREDFISYFNWQHEKFLDKKIYGKIRECLDDDVCIFWDNMYVSGWLDKFHGNIINYYRFSDDGSDSYSSPDRYEDTRNKLDSVLINYSYDDLHTFIENLADDRKYDAVFLSNIYDHLSFLKKKRFYKFISTECSRHLTDDGLMVVYTPIGQNNLVFSSYERNEKFDRGKVYVYHKNNRN